MYTGAVSWHCLTILVRLKRIGSEHLNTWFILRVVLDALLWVAGGYLLQLLAGSIVEVLSRGFDAFLGSILFVVILAGVGGFLLLVSGLMLGTNGGNWDISPIMLFGVAFSVAGALLGLRLKKNKQNQKLHHPA